MLAPLFAGGLLRALYEAADARRAQSAIFYHRTVLNVLRGVEEKLAPVALYGARCDDLIAQRAAVTQAVRHATKRYQPGYSSYLKPLAA